MNFWPWKIARKAETPAEKKLEEIRSILFPPVEKQELGGVKFQVDYCVDSNLDAALVDLESGHNDKKTQETINNCIKQLSKVRKILGAYDLFDKDAKYILVETKNEIEEEIVASDEIID